MRKIYEKIGKAEFYFCAVLIVAIVLLVFISTIMRVIKMPIPWSIDIAQLMFAWITFVGADVAYRQSKFVGVDILIKKAPEKIRTAVELLIHIIILAIVVFLIFNGIQLSIKNYMRTFQTLPITYAWVNSSLPVGCVFMSCTALVKIWDLGKNIFRPAAQNS